MYVRDWMSAPAIVAPTTMEAPAALALMEERKIRRLPLVEERRLVGMVTRGDLLQALGLYPTMWRRLDLKLSDVMKTNPVAVSPDATLGDVAHLMLDRKIGGIPVVKDGEPVGMITESDIFRALCKILGFGDKGTRIEFTTPAEEHFLDVLRERLKDREARTVMAYWDDRRNCWEVVLRLQAAAVA
jgi:CBS domain-containing protein